MKRAILAVAMCIGVSLNGCVTIPKSSQQNAEEVTQLYQTLTLRVTTAGEAAAVGQELTRHYLEGADAARNSRRNTNVVLLALTPTPSARSGLALTQ